MPHRTPTRGLSLYLAWLGATAAALGAGSCAPAEPEGLVLRKADFADDAGLPTHRCTDRPIVDISGLLDDSDGDVSVDLAAAIADVTANGWAAGLPPGVYPLAHPLALPSHSVLIGSGADTVLQASIDHGQWTEGDAMVELVSVEEVTLCDVVLDHQGGLRQANDQQLSFTMLMTDTIYDRIDGVEFRDPGGALDKGHRPSGPALLMLARQPCSEDVQCDKPYFDGSDPGVPGNVSKNIIEGSRFVLGSDATVAFAIRVYTDFETRRPAGELTMHASHNLLRNNEFIGDFAWNTVELAGGATVNNRVEDNTFDGHTLTHVDFDKGASYNVAAGNHIITSGRSATMYGAKYTTWPTFALFDHGSDAEYRNTGNTITSNVVDEMVAVIADSGAPSGGIGLQHTRAATVSGNQIDDLFDGQRGAGVLILGSTEVVEISGNAIGLVGPVNTGIAAHPTTLSENPFIQAGSAAVGIHDNLAEVTEVALFLGFGGPPSLFVDYEVADNHFTTSSTLIAAAYVAADSPLIERNTFTGGNKVVQLISPNALFANNRVGGSTGYTLQVSADATLLGNSAWGVGGPPPHPHCQLTNGATVTMGAGGDVNDFTCPP